ncbi:MAG: chemotaxis protein CheW [Novosphingobium sp.]
MQQDDTIMTASATPWDEAGQLEVLTFDVGDERLAIEAVSIREILDLLPETPVPGAPALVASVVNFRGKIIPIADLRVAFGMARDQREEANPDHRIVVIETEIGGEPLQIGLRSDKVHEVTILNRADSSEPPLLGMRWRREFARELVRQPGSVIVIPDLPTIFTSLAEAA